MLLVVNNFGHVPDESALVYSMVTVWPFVQSTSKLKALGVQFALVRIN